MRRPIGVQLADASRAYPGESAEDITRRIFANRTVREQAIVTEHQMAELRAIVPEPTPAGMPMGATPIHVSFASPSITLREILDYGMQLEREGVTYEVAWLRDREGVPIGMTFDGWFA